MNTIKKVFLGTRQVKAVVKKRIVEISETEIAKQKEPREMISKYMYMYNKRTLLCVKVSTKVTHYKTAYGKMWKKRMITICIQNNILINRSNIIMEYKELLVEPKFSGRNQGPTTITQCMYLFSYLNYNIFFLF